MKLETCVSRRRYLGALGDVFQPSRLGNGRPFDCPATIPARVKSRVVKGFKVRAVIDMLISEICAGIRLPNVSVSVMVEKSRVVFYFERGHHDKRSSRRNRATIGNCVDDTLRVVLGVD